MAKPDALIENAIRFNHDGGAVGVESELGKGSRFTLRLPIREKS